MHGNGTNMLINTSGKVLTPVYLYGRSNNFPFEWYCMHYGTPLITRELKIKVHP